MEEEVGIVEEERSIKTAEAAPVVSYTPKTPGSGKLKKTSKIPSLDDIKNLSLQPALVVEKEVKKEETVITDRNEAFGLQDLKKYWQDFAHKMKLKGNNQEYILLNEDISLSEDFNIEIKLTNPFQEETLNSLKTELIVFLREKLNNDKITLSSRMAAEETKKRLYTTREKFDHLVEKHPLLLELKEKLGLDPDF